MQQLEPTPPACQCRGRAVSQACWLLAAGCTHPVPTRRREPELLGVGMEAQKEPGLPRTLNQNRMLQPCEF